MKSILLASVASVAFAGVAAAEVTFSGAATLGYNDNTAGTHNGFYGDLSATVNFSQELNNGLTVAASIAIDQLNTTISSGTYELSLTSDSAGLYVGDTAFAAESLWSGVSGMADNFAAYGDGAENIAIRGEGTFGGVTVAVSYGIFGGQLDNQLQVAATGTFGSVDVGVAYQQHGVYSYTIEGYTVGSGDVSMIGLSAGTSLGGADVTVAYASITDNIDADKGTTFGIEASYPVGPVTVGGYYASSEGTNLNGVDTLKASEYGVSVGYASGPVSVDFYYDVNSGTLNGSTTTSNDWGLEGSYDVGNGIMAYAGVVTSGADYYIAGTYDLGGGAELLVSYAADADNSTGDAVGTNEYQIGTTVEVSFAF